MALDDFLRGNRDRGGHGRRMTRFALTIEFDGGAVLGPPAAGNGPSVQQSIEEAAHAVTGETVTLHSAGRTDSGVHALAMRSHVDIEKDDRTVPPDARRSMPNCGPIPSQSSHCEVKPDDWHARFSCIGRSLCLPHRNRRAPLTLEKGRAWHVARPLDARSDAPRRAGAGRATRFHHLPRGPLPGRRTR